MRHTIYRAALTLLLLLTFSTTLLGDVTKQSTTKMEFKGATGTMMKFLGVGKPTHSAEYLKGNVLRTDDLDKKGKKAEESRIIDLDQEVIITLNHKKKRYSKMTFEQFRAMMEENMERLKDLDQAEPEEQGDDEQPETDVKMNFSVDVSTPGETKQIAGYNAEKVLMTMNFEAEATEKKDDNQESEPDTAKGGMVVKSTHWIVKELDGDEEYRAFYLKMVEKMGFDFKSGGLGDMIGKIMQNNEQLATAMKEMQEQREALEGTPMEIHTVYETWGESSQEQGEQPKMSIPTSFGGLFGKKKKEEEPKQEAGPSVLMEMRTNTTKYSTETIDPAMFEIPAKYKEEKPKF